MLLFLTCAERRKRHWQYAHYWSRIRLCRKLVLVTALIGAAMGLVVSCATPPVYVSRVIIDTGECRHGVPVAGFPCALCEEKADPALITMASRLEKVAAGMGFTNLVLHHAVTNFLAH